MIHNMNVINATDLYGTRGRLKRFHLSLCHTKIEIRKDSIQLYFNLVVMIGFYAIS